MIRVAIVEDEPGLREQLAAQLGQHPEFAVVGVFADTEAALAGLAASPAEVVVTDIQLPGRSGIDLVREWKAGHPATQFLMLTMFEDEDRVFPALAAGATGYLLKRSMPAELASAVIDLHNGGSPMSSSIARMVVRAFQPAKPLATEKLSPREAELLSWLARGRTYKECADAMSLSLDTVRTYVRRIYEKLQVNCRHAAVTRLRTGRGFPP